MDENIKLKDQEREISKIIIKEIFANLNKYKIIRLCYHVAKKSSHNL